jgi:outer membrane lipase/esterase
MKRLIRAAASLPLLALAVPALAQTSAPATASGEPVNRIVVFGDSLADGGYFLTLDPRIPRDAGSFTTNPDPVAPEVMAARLGIDLRPVYGQGGTNYAIGGARVTAPNGPSLSITTQINNFIASGGTFGPRDLVYIQGGGNDFFAFQAAGGTNNATLTTAATQLAAQVARVQAAGASRIVTLAVQTGGNAGLVLFNQTFAAALASSNVNALYFDTDRLFNEIVANASSFGIAVTTTGVACTVPSSLNCNRSTLVTPNANETYLLADSVHPAGITQRIQGQALASLVKAPEQIAGLGYAAQTTFRAQRDLFEAPMRGVAHNGRRVVLFGNAGYRYYDSGNSAQRVGIVERGFAGVLGADLAIGERSGIGIVGGYSDGKGDFTGAGDYRAKAWSASGYGRLGVGPFRLLVDGTYGEIDYNRIRRTVVLGPTTREQRGTTDGDYVAGRATVAVDLFTDGAVGIGPDLSIGYDRITLDGYSEAAPTSTSAAFGRQRIESLTGRAGIVARALPESSVGFFARASYEREFDDDPRTITIRPTGAPISFTTGVERADRDYMSYALGVDGRLFGGPLGVRAGVSGQTMRDDRDSVTGFAGLSLAF